MSRKSDIYAAYRSKIDEANARVGGEPTYDRFPKAGEVQRIQGLPCVSNWQGQKGYVEADGSVKRLIRDNSCFHLYTVEIFQNVKHFEGYREPMGSNQYFEC